MGSVLTDQLVQMRKYFMTATTLSYEFRIEQLKKLRAAVKKFEHEISDALYKDLKKSPEETWATETGLLMAEINVTLTNLRQWMRPQPASTNFVNLPSSSKIYRDPLGVVLIIAPWNYPLQLLLIPLVGAIAGGNCVVLKPSEFATATAAIVEKLIEEIYSPEYILIVKGDGAEVVPAMMKNFRFDHVFYTGSIPVGKAIYKMAAEQLVPVTLELGGKSPAIVERDANLSAAARRIVLGKFINAGQTCIAPDYVLVHQDVKDKLVTKLKSTIESFYTSDPASSYDYGKIINEKRFDKLVSYLDEGKILHGGKHNKAALYIEPTLLDTDFADLKNDFTDFSSIGNESVKSVSQSVKSVFHSSKSVLEEEIFGPVLPIISFKDFESARSIVERNSNPLAFYLFTNDRDLQRSWIEQVSFGGGCINNADWHFTNHHLPFGGVGSSGMGAYHGKYTFDTFTRPKSVMKTPTWFDPSLKYPPYKGKLKLFKWFFR